MSVHQKPVKRTLINITDGSRREFLDDGSDVDALSGTVKGPRVRRRIIVQALDTLITKGPHKGSHVFYAEEKWAPLFDGDPLANVRVLDDVAKKKMQELVAERERFLATSKVQADNEAALALKKAKRANENAAQS